MPVTSHHSLDFKQLLDNPGKAEPSTMNDHSPTDYAVYKLDPTMSATNLRKYTRLRTEAWQAVFHNDLVHSPLAFQVPSARRHELEADDFHCWVCVLPNAQNNSLGLKEGQWVGLVVVQGPYCEAEYSPDRKRSPATQKEILEMQWRLRGLYFVSMHRDLKLYAALEKTVAAWIEIQAAETCKASGRESVLIRQRITAEVEGATHKGFVTQGYQELKRMTKVEKLRDDGWLDASAQDALTAEDYDLRQYAVFEVCRLYRAS